VGFAFLCNTPGSPADLCFGGTGSASAVPAGSAASHAVSTEDPVDTLRRVRDEAMAESPAGRYYRDLYDGFSAELREVVLDDLRIVRDVFVAAPALLETLGDLIDGGGAEATITGEMVASMLAIFDRFEERASPALREVFRRERERLGLEQVAELSIEAAAALVKVLDGRAINDRFWVFYGALSDVEYTVL
jgi:hypothetical protein